MRNVERVRFEATDDSHPCFAIYENPGERILISEDGLHVESLNADIRYSDIAKATCLVDDEVLLDGVMLFMKNGQHIKVKMSGHDGKFYDAHAFVRFLMRTVEDRISLQEPTTPTATPQPRPTP